MRSLLAASVLIVGIIEPQSLIAAEEKTLMRLACQRIEHINVESSKIPGVYILTQNNTEIYDGTEMMTFSNELPYTEPVPFMVTIFPNSVLEVEGKGYVTVAGDLLGNVGTIPEAIIDAGVFTRVDDVFRYDKFGAGIATVFIYSPVSPAASIYRVGGVVTDLYCYPAFTVPE
jgi:hypothetical protein